MVRMAAFAFIAGLYGVAGAQLAPERSRDNARQELDESTPASRQELFVRDPSLRVDGTNVYLEHMVVRAKSGHMMRVAYGKHEIFVAPVDPSTLDFVAVGAKVDVRGTLRDAPSASQARLVYAMSPREARLLARSGVYVDAWSVTAIE